jgi:DNA-binding GntR family transcriptional regulator
MTTFDQIITRFSDTGNAAEKAYGVLRQAIITDVLVPGTRLLADDLAKKIGVSKTPVREALRKLQAEDLIMGGPGNTLMVKVITENQLLEIYYTREALEGMAARLAAENAGPIELSRLRAVVEDVESAMRAGDIERMRSLSGQFHLTLFRASRNELLYRLLKNLQEQVRQGYRTTLSQPGRPEEMCEFCRNLLALVEKRDADGAEKLARENRRRTMELRLRMLRS